MKLFQKDKRFRWFLFLVIGLITVTTKGCANVTMYYGFPTVYAWHEYRGIGEPAPDQSAGTQPPSGFLVQNLVLDILAISAVFFFVEAVRNRYKREKDRHIFDCALLTVLVYLIATSVLIILDHDDLQPPTIPIILSSMFFTIVGIYPQASIISKFFIEGSNVDLRLGIIPFSIILFFLVYYVIKGYHYLKPRFLTWRRRQTGKRASR